MIPQPTRPLVEVADILRAHGETYAAGHAVSALQAAVLRRLEGEGPKVISRGTRIGASITKG